MKTDATTLTRELSLQMDAYWRVANYLSVGQMSLFDNPLLKRPLTLTRANRWSGMPLVVSGLVPDAQPEGRMLLQATIDQRSSSGCRASLSRVTANF